jgi:hypothetical protein
MINAPKTAPGTEPIPPSTAATKAFNPIIVPIRGSIFGYFIPTRTLPIPANDDPKIKVKEIRLSPNVEINDLKTKANNARKFIEKGDKVKVTLRFRGREMAHISSNAHVLDDFAKMLEDIASVVKAPKLEGRNMTMFLEKKR